MRSPREALGHFALESVMDELAYTTGVDPVALRLRNDTEIDPHSGRPFSARAMRKCLMEAAARFGWDKRTPQPRSMRDGRYLIGQGNAGASVMLAAKAARDRAIELSLTGRNAPFAGAVRNDVLVSDGTLVLARKNLNITNVELLARNGLATLVGDGNYDPVEEANGPKAVFSFAAVFAEVRVDPDLGLVRLNRVVGAYDAGRIINPKTARSQAIGGIIWGVGQALLEQS